MAKRIIRLTESDLHRIIKNSVKKIIREAEEPYDWRSDFHLYHDSVNMKPEDGTALHKKYMDGARQEFGGDEKARVKEFNRLWKEREARRKMRQTPEQIAKEDLWDRKYNAEHGIEGDEFEDTDFDDEAMQKALDRAKRKKASGLKRQMALDNQISQERTMSDDELQARLKDLQAQGMLK